jgi:hypothetical protein
VLNHPITFQMCHVFNVGCKNFIEDFCIYVHQGNWSRVFFFLISLSSFGIGIIMAS